ncbi:MAG: DMT family transporter [Alphaproteobacteria bacterium]|jgi:drug/metabolite transporter (DMT)-like permease|nr:DMT family transporter [Alphaproteobacteria bacterium]
MRVKLRRMIFSSGLALPTFLLLLGGAAYGSYFSANKLAVEAGMPVFAYSFWQIVIASAVLLPVSAVLRSPPKLNIRHLRVYGLVAIVGLTGPTLIVVVLADKLPPAVVTLAAALIAAATYLLALAVKSESFRWLSLLGVALGFSGVLFIVLPEKGLDDPAAVGWVLFALLLPASAAMNNVFTAKLMPEDVNSLSLTTGLMTFSALLLLILMLVIDGPVALTHAGFAGVWPTLWASAAIVVTYLCFFEILRRAGALFFAQLNYVVVAAGVLWAYLIFGDEPNIWLWAAIAVIALGLAVMNYSKAKTLGRAGE